MADILDLSAFDALPDPAHIIDDQYRMRHINRAAYVWYRQTGLDGDVMLGKPPWEAYPYVPPDIRKHYEEVTRTGLPVISNELLALPDRLIALEIIRTPVYGVHPDLHVLTIIRDQTNLWEAQIRGLAGPASSETALVLFDEQGVLRYANSVWFHLTGYGPEWINRLSVFDVDHLVDREDLRSIWKGNHLLSQIEHERTLVCRNGRRLRVDVNCQFLDFVQQRFLSVVLRDVSERHRQWQSIVESRDQLQLAMSALDSRIILYSQETGEILLHNAPLSGARQSAVQPLSPSVHARASDGQGIEWLHHEMDPERWLHIREVAINWRGIPANLQVQHDITRQHNTELRLNRAVGTSALLLRLTERLLALTPGTMPDVLMMVLSDIACHLECDRCTLYMLESDGRTIGAVRSWQRMDVNDEPNIGQGHLIDDRLWLYRQLQHGQAVVVPHDATPGSGASLAADPEAPADDWHPDGRTTMLYMPVFRQGHLSMVITAVNPGRAQAEDIQFFRVYGEAFNQGLSRFQAEYERELAESAMNSFVDAHSFLIAYHLMKDEHAPLGWKPVWYNNGALQRFRRGPISDIRNWFRVVYRDDLEDVQRHWELLTQGKSVQHEFRMWSDEHNDWRWMRHVAEALPDDSGTPWRISGITVDIHDRVMAEHQLKILVRELQQAVDELTEFSAVVSHDLKAPLFAARAQLEQLIADNTWTVDDLQHVISRLNKMEALINGILAYSQAGMDTEPSAPIDVQSVVDFVLYNIAHTHTVEVIVSPTLPTVMGAFTPLEQVFQNLVGNAVRYNTHPRPTVWIRGWYEGAMAVFEVADNGPGIPQSIRQRPFDMFTTSDVDDRPHGSGIGLAIVRRLVWKYGGDIHLDPAYTDGCLFRFTWPAAVHAAQPPDQEGSA